MIKKLREYIRNRAVNEPKLLIFNSVNLICLIGVGLLVLIETIMNYEQKGLFTIALIFIGLLCIFAIANIHKNLVDLLIVLFLFPLNLIFLPYLFIFGEGGGVSSAMPMWFLFGILLNIILLDGKLCLVLLVLTCIIDILSMYISFKFPHLTNYSSDPFYYFEDNMICIVLVAASIGLILKYMKYIDKVQKEAIEEKSENIFIERNNAIKANRTKTLFLSNISHDIRTPLTDILGMAAKCEAHIDDKEILDESIKQIVNYSMELLYLFDNTLELSEIESGGLRIKENRFYLPELLIFVENTAKEKAQNNHLSFRIEKKSNLDKFLVGDSSKIRQILLLLLDNSMKYTRAGGEVVLSIEKDFTRQDGFFWYQIIVKDDGIGMDRDFLENELFEPFVRGKEDFVRNTSGSGIGMSIVKSLVEAMNGKITVNSEKNVGTKVILDIPLQRDLLFGTNMEDRLFFEVRDVDVMVIDDDSISSDIISKLLERVGIRTKIFIDAESAYEELKYGVTPYKMIISDIVLPNMDGYNLASLVRNLERFNYSNIPIIAVTANAFSLAEEKAILSGMNEYISKPIDMTEFYQKIYRYLGKYSV